MPLHVENPHLLPLLLIALLPLVLHIIDRRRARRVVWPAARFLIVGAREKLRHLRWLEVLLIVLRTIAVLALAAAALKPFVVETRLGPASTRGVATIAIAVDTSFSMAWRDEASGSSSLHRARNTALRALERAGAAARTRVLSADDPPETAARTSGTSARTHEDARATLRSLAVGPESFHLAGAIEEASRHIEGSPAGDAEILVLTDFTAPTIRDEDTPKWSELRTRLDALVPRPVVRLVDCGFPAAQNRFIGALRTGGQVAGTDRELEMEFVVERAGAESTPSSTAEAVTLRIEDGVQEIAAEAITLRERSTTARLSHRFPRGGEQLLTARIPADGLAFDDVRYRVLDVLDDTAVLVAGDAAVARETTRLVRLALRPTEAASDPSESVFRPVVSTAIESEEFARFRVVVMCDVGRVDSDLAERLEFVRQGGGLLVFLGAEVHQESWNAFLFRGGRGPLPARLGARRASRTREPAHPSRVRVSHPTLRVFADPEEGDLGRIGVKQWIRLDDLAVGATVLASIGATGEETPWIVDQAYGGGRVVLVATSATRAGTDLPRSTLFLPLVQELTRWLATPPAGSRELATGQAIELPLPDAAAAKRAVVVDPAGAHRTLELTVRDGRPVGVFRGTRLPGIYTIHDDEPSADSEPRRFAVHVPSEESRLDRLEPARVEAIARTLGAEILRHDEPPPQDRVETRAERPLWLALVALAALLLVLELLLARRLGGAGA